MKIILDDLSVTEFFENGGVVILKDGTKITDVNAFCNLTKDTDDKEYENLISKCKIGDKYYEYNIDEASFYYRDIKKFLSTKDAYGIKNVNFTLIDENDNRWEHYRKLREEKGYDPSELWSLDYTISRFIYPRLKDFAENHCGYPMGMTDKEWTKILNKMVKAFEILSKESLDYTKEEENTIDEGLKLFIEYFQNLWD